MQRIVQLTDGPVNSTVPFPGIDDREWGAQVIFEGLVREKEGDQSLQGIQYEAYSSMAEKEFHRILDEVESRWNLLALSVIHSTGPVPVGQASIRVICCSSHRAEAFEACQYLIDEMKRRVPIWKHPY